MSVLSDIPARARAVLDFWFGELDAQGMPARAKMRRWFESDSAFDDEIRTRFGEDLARARDLNDWRSSPAGTLALVIVADQFSRNVHRGTPDAFALDDFALALTTDAVDSGADRALQPIERVFLYMPMEHAEDLEVQERSVRCSQALAREVPATLSAQFEYFAEYAQQHREVIARFGRFPHRNSILGRLNTAAEAAYLKSGVPGWGQQAQP